MEVCTASFDGEESPKGIRWTAWCNQFCTLAWIKDPPADHHAVFAKASRMQDDGDS